MMLSKELIQMPLVNRLLHEIFYNPVTFNTVTAILVVVVILIGVVLFEEHLERW